MSEAYKIFRQLQEKEKQAQQYKSYEREDLIDEIINLQQENNQLKDRINKAVEILNNENESCQGALTNPEYTIVSKHQLLKNDINIIKKLIDLLKGDKE